MKPRITYLGFSLVLCVLYLSACSSLESVLKSGALPAQETTTAASLTFSLDSLKGKTWRLIKLKDIKGTLLDIPSTQQLTLTFSQNELSGSGGCNRFQATFILEGNQIAIGNLITTTLYCASDETGANYERDYFTLLPQTSFLLLEGNTLILQNIHHETTLVFSSEFAQ